MQFYNVVLALASAASVLGAPAAVPESSPVARSDEILRRSCSTGFSIQTFGSNNCGQFEQGVSNSGKGCNVCVQMGDANSWRIINPDHCGRMTVTYYHGANCAGDIARDVTYDTGAQACNAIPTDIGDHFSARFVCVS